MRFTLIDRITELKAGSSLTAIKGLSLAEDYLEDHFPRFPVMPGVLMLEAMYQASAWLIRASEDFAHSAVLLKEAKNIKYTGFVEPGQQLTVEVKIIKQDDQTTTLKTQGAIEGFVAVRGRLILERFNLCDRYPLRSDIDNYARRKLKEDFTLLYPYALSK